MRWLGRTADLGELAPGASNFPNAINNRNQIVGQALNGDTDPDTGYWQGRGFLWQRGTLRVLDTLGGTQSFATDVNDRGLVAGMATTADPDPLANVPVQNCKWTPNLGPDCQYADFSFNALFAPSTTRVHAVIWKHGVPHDLGTLGGPDSTAILINEGGQAIGWSYTSFQPNASGAPDVHPFLWDNGRMTDLGTLGGTVAVASFVNSFGVVVGASNTAGDAELHAFVWDRKHGMRDIGTLGGTYAHPDWVNDRGDAVGYSNTAPDESGHTHGRAFFWHDGVMKNLGTIGDDDASEAYSINNRCQIVGQTFIRGGDDLKGFYSDCGGPLVDLDTLVWPPSNIHVTAANVINDQGVIAGQGVSPDGEQHPILLEPW
jgi:probable HAF family extracellular repeat protein